MIHALKWLKGQIKAITRGFNDVSIRKKLVISYIVVVIVPVLLVGVILTSSMRRLALDQAVHESTVNVDRVKKRISDIMRVSKAISDKLLTDKNLQEILNHNYQSTWEVVKTYWGYRTLDEYPTVYNDISMVRVYSTNPTILENWRFMKATNAIIRAPWYQEALINNGKISWSYIQYPETNSAYFSLIRLITGTNPALVLTISINSDFLNNILKQESFETLLIDKNGYIVAASDQSLPGKTARDMQLGEALSGSGIIEQLNYKGKISQVIFDAISPEESYDRLQIVSIFPVTQIMSKANQISRLGLTIISVSLLLSFLIILVLSRALTERIRILSSGTHLVASGNLNYSMAVEGQDEIGQLSADLNLMIRSIKDLLAEVYEISLQKKQQEIEQKDIKLKLLANQINPHFFFNVLETIRMKAHSHGELEIAQIVKLLGKILRCNLEAGSEPVPLASELDLVSGYLEIQKFRFGDQLNYRIEVADDIKGNRVLPLIIQPIVENAVIHGLESKEEKGLITITATHNANLLRIVVKDDGMGIEPVKMRALEEALANPESKIDRHIGIKNVHQRIRLFYGEEYGLRINSQLNQGTEVAILLPWKGDLDV
ncbi:MAG: sensor histidine kinase [Firmicutes bacterium]|nr:sensor histidine kinase [Bacillota bacterium]